jgi:hypothetical protein
MQKLARRSPQSRSQTKIRSGKGPFSLSALATLTLTTAGMLATSLPAHALFYGPTRLVPRASDFEACANRLLGAGISAEEAARACARALDPGDLSRCVSRIETGTEVDAIAALDACKRVRRPIEMASCVVDIDSAREDAVALDVLDHCRRSLLPTRFSACVIGLSREIDFSTASAMSTCIAAGDRPSEFNASFEPSDGSLLELTPTVPAR